MNPVIFNLKNKLRWMATRLRWINEEKAIKGWIGTMEEIYTLMEKASRNGEQWERWRTRHQAAKWERQLPAWRARPQRKNHAVRNMKNKENESLKKKSRVWERKSLWRASETTPTDRTLMAVDE